MAAVVKCDMCGRIVEYEDAMHIKFHQMSSTTEYYSRTEAYADVCEECYRELLQKLNIGGKK